MNFKSRMGLQTRKNGKARSLQSTNRKTEETVSHLSTCMSAVLGEIFVHQFKIRRERNQEWALNMRNKLRGI
ncbi:hypothetical protein KC19_VG109600 [Ceratodon purpureus]|uniref:Uncharacterized protein n=1 Tax=Ceratodon purpureus TaxID=3225 RepID=A0A8T0HP03_CERPU|nr:hypothetical protein KC19_VG109600 [Ceratodon purpureus]